MQPQPRLKSLHVSSYRVFGERTDLDLAPITVLIGKNNSGKSALCRAPRLFTAAIRVQSRVPVPLQLDDYEVGDSLLDLCFNRSPSGLSLELSIDGIPGLTRLALGVTEAPEAFARQLLTHFKLRNGPDETFSRGLNTPWEEIRKELERYPGLQTLASSILWLPGIRMVPRRGERWSGLPLEHSQSELAQVLDLLAWTEMSNDREPLDRMNSWLKSQLGIELEPRLSGRQLDLFIRKPGIGLEAVHLQDSGAGLGQLLPLVVLLFLRSSNHPLSLVCVEQPELHLHPAAHPAIAELFIERAIAADGPSVLVETHSDPLVMRIRVAIAEGRLKPEQVKLYFVGPRRDPKEGNGLTEIRLDEDGIPDWWPEGIFAEPQLEFRRLRQAIQRRHEGRP